MALPKHSERPYWAFASDNYPIRIQCFLYKVIYLVMLFTRNMPRNTTRVNKKHSCLVTGHQRFSRDFHVSCTTQTCQDATSETINLLSRSVFNHKSLCFNLFKLNSIHIYMQWIIHNNSSSQ